MQATNFLETNTIQQKINKLEWKKDIQQFNTNLEKGDLGLSQVVENGYILYGDTRAGKTTLGHLLSGNSLRGVKMNGEYMVQATTSKNKNAVIGNSMRSETLVPNKFSVHLKDKKQDYSLIDTPGYGDTNGILTIIANGYYHYRLYSQVKNIKFIVCFDAAHLQNTYADFIKTIIQWTSSFKDYLLVRKQIWKSLVFIVTKAEDKPDIKDDLIAKLKNVQLQIKTLYEKNVEDALKELIEFIIKEDRLFSVKKIKQGETLVAGDLLDRIDKKISHWWSRDYDEDRKQVNMDSVSFPLSKQIVNSTTGFPKSRKQFIELIEYYNLRIKEFKSVSEVGTNGQGCSLSFVIQELIKDAMGHPDSHKFIDVMKNYINLYYHKYDDSYKEEREKRQKDLFSLEENPSQTQTIRQKFRGKDKSYFVKKFRCLDQIEFLKNEINDFEVKQSDRDVDSIDECAQNLYNIIKELNRVAFKMSYASSIIYKYGYILHRIIEEAKIFILLIQIYGAQHKHEVRQQANGKYIDLIVELKDFMGLPFKYNKKEVTYEELHLAFINQFSFKDERYSSLVINEDIVAFFTHVDIHDESDMTKQTQVVLRYSDTVLAEAQNSTKVVLDKQKGKLIRKLANIRANCQISYSEKVISSPQQLKQCVLTIRKASKNLGKLLELLGQHKLSRQVYKSVRFVDSVCKLYHSEINLLKNLSIKNEETRRKQIGLRIQFGKYLAQYFRENEAIYMLQESYELAEDMEEIEQIKKLLVQVKQQIKDIDLVNQYQSNLFNDPDFDTFSEQLSDQLDQYSRTAID